MNKKLLIVLLMLNSFLCFSQTRNIKIILEDGAEYIKKIDENSSTITLVSTEWSKQLKEVKNIEGLENFKNLKRLELYFFKHYGNFDFLSRLNNLKELAIDGSIASIQFLSSMKSLEKFELNVFINHELRDSYETTKVSLKKLNNLKEITLSTYYEYDKKVEIISHIPPFVKVNNYPILKLNTSDDVNFTKKDYKYAKQYSRIISLNPNAKWTF